jgi:hypothetical protein
LRSDWHWANAGYTNIGQSAKPYFESAARVLNIGGAAVAVGGVLYNTTVGYQRRGADEAGLQFTVGSINATIDFGLTVGFGVPGAATAFGFESKGGILGLSNILNTAAMTRSCLGGPSDSGGVSPY